MKKDPLFEVHFTREGQGFVKIVRGLAEAKTFAAAHPGPYEIRKIMNGGKTITIEKEGGEPVEFAEDNSVDLSNNPRFVYQEGEPGLEPVEKEGEKK